MAQISLKWWPVGQGLFMTGRLRGASGGVFDWVYDCGSLSGQEERDNAIKSYRDSLPRKHIDLVTLSHFDLDHINGIVALLKGFSVGMLLLPYAPLWKRLLIAMDEGITSADPLFEFYLNPVSYFARETGGGLRQVVFVPEANADDVVPPSDGPLDWEQPLDGFEAEYGDAPTESIGDTVIDDFGGMQVRFLKPAGRIFIPNLWEFIPYNDPKKTSSIRKPFEKWVTHIARIFTINDSLRAKGLKILKKGYPRWFGSEKKG